MSQLFVESDAPEPGPFTFQRDPLPLLALLSFGVAEPFLSHHPLTVLVRKLRHEHGLEVGPLFTFYDREAETEEDRRNLDAAWQPADALRDCIRAVRVGLAQEPEAPALLEGFAAVPDLLAELEAMAAWAADHDARIRVSFSLT